MELARLSTRIECVRLCIAYTVAPPGWEPVAFLHHISPCEFDTFGNLCGIKIFAEFNASIQGGGSLPVLERVLPGLCMLRLL